MRQMKDSGVKWIGEIPSEWEVLPHKYVMRKVKEQISEYNNEDILSLTMKGVIVRDLANGGKIPASFVGYQICKPGNLLLCLFDIDVTPRCVGLIKNDGVSSPAYSQFELSSCAHGGYYDYLLRYMDDYKCLLHLSKNLRSSLTESDFGLIPTILPPFPEQQRIASYLDEKCGEIDHLVSLQEQMKEELKAYKQSVITEAVTRGLDPNAKLKPSGVEWIGDVPEDWEVKRFKNVAHVLRKGNGITKDEIVVNGDTPCVRYGEIYTKYNTSFSECATRTNNDIIKSPKYFSHGDLLFSGTGELIEEIGKCIVYLGYEQCLAGGDIIIAEHSEYPLFMGFAMDSNYVQSQKSYGKAKLKVIHISATDIGDIMLALPPLSTQRAIAAHLDTKTAEIDQLIAIKQQKIDELKDYKKSLIYECVTGKKEIV